MAFLPCSFVSNVFGKFELHSSHAGCFNCVWQMWIALLPCSMCQKYYVRQITFECLLLICLTLRYALRGFVQNCTNKFKIFNCSAQLHTMVCAKPSADSAKVAVHSVQCTAHTIAQTSSRSKLQCTQPSADSAKVAGHSIQWTAYKIAQTSSWSYCRTHHPLVCAKQITFCWFC